MKDPVWLEGYREGKAHGLWRGMRLGWALSMMLFIVQRFATKMGWLP